MSAIAGQTSSDELTALVTDWLDADEQVRAHKLYRELVLSVIRAKLIASGKLSWSDGTNRVRALPRYLVACASCHIDMRECRCTVQMRLDDEPRSVQVYRRALNAPEERWIQVERIDLNRAHAPRVRVLERVEDDEK